MVAHQRAVELTCCLVEVGDMAGFLQLIQVVRNSDIMLGFQPRPPEAAAELHLLVVDFLQTPEWWRVLWFLCGISVGFQPLSSCRSCFPLPNCPASLLNLCNSSR